jgi:hypothetical protein
VRFFFDFIIFSLILDAAGMLGPAQWIETDHFGPKWTWRVVFIAEAALMFPFVLLCLVTRGPPDMTHLKPERLDPELMPEDQARDVLGGGDGSTLLGDVTDDLDEIENIPARRPASVVQFLDEANADHGMSERNLLLGTDDGGCWERTRGKLLQVWYELEEVFKNRLWLFITIGYTTQTFVTGGFAAYGIRFLEGEYKYDVGEAGTGGFFFFFFFQYCFV